MNPVLDTEPTVHVVDDNSAVRDSVRWLVEQVGLRARTYNSGAEFLAAWHHGMYGCVILDVRMPGLSGLDVQQRLIECGADLPVIMITGHGDVPVAVRAMKSGALEFLQKPFGDQDLLDCINVALKLHQVRRLAHERNRQTEKALSSLTPRERDVLRLLRDGNSSKQIAYLIGISVRTVEGHRARVMNKLGARTLPQLIGRLWPGGSED